MGRSTVAAVVLAAGESRRFGGRKQLAILDGKTLLEHVLLTADAVSLRPVIAVVPVWLTRPVTASPDLVWVRNPYPERGMSESLRLGVRAVPDDVDAAVILLGDQPTVDVEAIRGLLDQRGDRPIVASEADGVFGPPILVERSRFAVFDGLTGDVGLRHVLGDHPDWVATHAIGAEHVDVDTRADLDRLRGH